MHFRHGRYRWTNSFTRNKSAGSLSWLSFIPSHSTMPIRFFSLSPSSADTILRTIASARLQTSRIFRYSLVRRFGHLHLPSYPRYSKYLTPIPRLRVWFHDAPKFCASKDMSSRVISVEFHRERNVARFLEIIIKIPSYVRSPLSVYKLPEFFATRRFQQFHFASYPRYSEYLTPILRLLVWFDGALMFYASKDTSSYIIFV